MRVGVKWVYQQIVTDGERGEAGQKPALCLQGRKHLLCVVAAHPVRVIKRAAADFDRYRDVTMNGGEYSAARAVKQLLDIAAKNGITKGAAALLDRIKANDGQDIDEESYNDEEQLSMNPEKPSQETTDNSETSTNGQTTEETTMSTKKGKKSKGKAVAKAKSNGSAPKGKRVKGESRIAKAVAYMKEQVAKEGGQKSLERGWRKELFAKTAEKFGLAESTCSIQWNRQIINKTGMSGKAGK